MAEIDTFRFTDSEYETRLSRVRAAMEAKGIDTLITSDPSNMAWLTGYDGWSFYVHQCVVLPFAGEPVLVRPRAGRAGRAAHLLAAGRRHDRLSRPLCAVGPSGTRWTISPRA
jgi:Xaa-Pro aminopeptidase